MSLKGIMEANELSLSKVAQITGYDKSTVSRVAAGIYPKSAEKEEEIVRKIVEAGFTKPAAPERSKLRIAKNVFVPTTNNERFERLCDSLVDPEGLLTSSIGLCIGTAGRGKTCSSIRYAAMNQDVVYVLYVDGYTQTKLLKEVAFELCGTKPITFERCLEAIEEGARFARKLVIIDEADKMPLRYIEMLRAINERCSLPLLLVGEEELYAKLANVPRLKSRVRKPIVKFMPIDIVDVSAFYKIAIGLTIQPEVANELCNRANGDFRVVVNDAMAIVNILNTSGLSILDSSILSRLRV